MFFVVDDTQEQSELQLYGLVVREQNKLRVYNPIYKEIFEQNWIETQLRNLRPYSENFKFCIASGGTDESRLLRGKALHDALEWAKDKSLNYQDRQFLAASQAKKIKHEVNSWQKLSGTYWDENTNLQNVKELEIVDLIAKGLEIVDLIAKGKLGTINTSN